MKDYINNLIYKYIIIIFINNSENAVKFPFIKKFNDFIFHFNSIIRDYTFIFKRLYVLKLYIKNIL